MPPTRLLYYRDSGNRVPVFQWLLDLRRRNPLAFVKCITKIERLAALGHELRRPEADLLRDGIYELRAHAGRVQYRILYFFHGSNVAILAHALVKEDRLPPADINRALIRKREVETDAEAHTADMEDFDLGQEEET